ncbi:MAG: recombinase [Candidatus Omnitrophica bacterium]|nr:recombinase [Candidatus Omnitrophota bacterium]
MTTGEKMRILLHACCGICASSVIERILTDGHRIQVYFYNPNIHPVDEYRRRRDACKKVAGEWDVGFTEGPYDREKWFSEVRGMEYLPEGAERCAECFRIRLERTFQKMGKDGFDAFCTTLTVSPHKDAEMVNRIGRRIGGEAFINADFKKKGGFQRANELSSEWGLYRQHYCGCVYSEEQMYRKSKDLKGNDR